MDDEKLTLEQEQEIYRVWATYRREADRCKSAKAYISACVMAGAALEAALILMVNAFWDEAKATGKAVNKPLDRWDLAELVTVAKVAGWFPAGLIIGEDDWKPSKAQVGDRVEVVRMLRNLLHPGRYMREHYRRKVTEKYAQFALDAVSEANDWLFSRVEKSLLDHMARENEAGESGLATIDAGDLASSAHPRHDHRV